MYYLKCLQWALICKQTVFYSKTDFGSFIQKQFCVLWIWCNFWFYIVLAHKWAYLSEILQSYWSELEANSLDQCRNSITLGDNGWFGAFSRPWIMMSRKIPAAFSLPQPARPLPQLGADWDNCEQHGW